MAVASPRMLPDRLFPDPHRLELLEERLRHLGQDKGITIKLTPPLTKPPTWHISYLIKSPLFLFLPEA